MQLLELADGAAEPALVARCRAIAQRERELGWAPYAAIAANLAGLVGAAEGPRLLERLAAEIRQGRFDAPGREQARLKALLGATVRQKLRENNPSFII